MAFEPLAENGYHGIIIGGGPAGLTCALYLARFNRKALVVSREDQRARWIPRTWNFPGHSDGLPGPELLANCRAHAERYGAKVVEGDVKVVNGALGGFHVRLADGQDFRAHNVVLATGVRDVLPDIPNVERYFGHGLRACPVCDGYEATGKRIAMFGNGNFIARHALFMTTFTENITILFNGRGRWGDISPDLRAQLETHGIQGVDARVTEVMADGAEIRGFCFEDGGVVEVDRAYAALGSCAPRSELARDLGCATDSNGFIKVNEHQQTNVEGVYAAGDVVNVDYAQVVIGMGQAAVAAIHMQNRYFSEG